MMYGFLGLRENHMPRKACSVEVLVKNKKYTIHNLKNKYKTSTMKTPIPTIHNSDNVYYLDLQTNILYAFGSNEFDWVDTLYNLVKAAYTDGSDNVKNVSKADIARVLSKKEELFPALDNILDIEFLATLPGFTGTSGLYKTNVVAKVFE